MTDILISIIIPVYNGSRHILETLESVKKQTYSNWEIVIVNDCSIDDTVEIVNQFAQGVSNSIKLITNKKNLGVSVSRNTAVSNCTGKWLALLDSDDIWLPNHLETLVNQVEKDTEISVVYAGCKVFLDDINNIVHKQAIDKVMLDNFKISLYAHEIGINSSTSFIKKDAWGNCGGMIQGLNFGEEMELFIRLARNNKKFKFSEYYTVLYRKHSNFGAASNNSVKMALGNLYIYEKHFDWEVIPFKIRKNQLSNAHLSYARLVRHLNIKKATQHALKALKVKKNLKNVVYFSLFSLLSIKL